MQKEYCKTCEQNKAIAVKYEDRFFAIRVLLEDIVDEYDAAPDGPLGKGFTNASFLAAKAFLAGA